MGEDVVGSPYDDISEGWSFSEFVHIHRDHLTKTYTLIVLEGRRPLFTLVKYDMTDVVNAFKLMRLEEHERKKQFKWTIF